MIENLNIFLPFLKLWQNLEAALTVCMFRMGQSTVWVHYVHLSVVITPPEASAVLSVTPVK